MNTDPTDNVFVGESWITSLLEKILLEFACLWFPYLKQVFLGDTSEESVEVHVGSPRYIEKVCPTEISSEPILQQLLVAEEPNEGENDAAADVTGAEVSVRRSWW